MLYYLYEYLTNHGIHIPGLNLLKYISFRAAFAVLLSLLIALVYGIKIINYLRNKVDKPFDHKLIKTMIGMGYILTEETIT